MRNLDFFRKPDYFIEKSTISGGILTIITVIVQK